MSLHKTTVLLSMLLASFETYSAEIIDLAVSPTDSVDSAIGIGPKKPRRCCVSWKPGINEQPEEFRLRLEEQREGVELWRRSDELKPENGQPSYHDLIERYKGGIELYKEMQ
ncbi:hypothetical protein [Pseudomonas sp. NFACC13-1]|uniref:hypothetical protein n=1 Tax=Pseudomonas sp. NFACC13-1 TaxID=1566245 RepID=UPI00088F90CF|nr:hypothetical protein [Pseudomonas sp. NFACC13-1]SDB39978.1 hypothetical protein SAMN03159290_02928 [Pseudomonas sp. NFACC13-1]